MVSDIEVVQQCLESVAEVEVDISPTVYAVFSANMPESDQHVSFMDDRMKGRMLDQVYQLLLGEADREYREFEARTHRGYGANESLYRGLLTAVKETVRDTLGQDWKTEYEAAWDRSIENIVNEFSQVH